MDTGIRDGAWSFAIVNDWVDAAAHRNYALDAEHDRYRAQVASVCAELARVLLEIL